MAGRWALGFGRHPCGSLLLRRVRVPEKLQRLWEGKTGVVLHLGCREEGGGYLSKRQTATPGFLLHGLARRPGLSQALGALAQYRRAVEDHVSPQEAFTNLWWMDP